MCITCKSICKTIQEMKVLETMNQLVVKLLNIISEFPVQIVTSHEYCDLNN